MRKLFGLVAALALVVIGVAAGVSLADRIDSGTDRESDLVDKPELDVAQVIRTDLITRKAFDAALAYVGERTLIGQLAGTVTALPEEGSVLDPGDIAIEIDGYPVIVMEGARPMWRPLQEDIDPGLDVLQLETALQRLGYFDADQEPDTEFDGDTAGAVEQWREAMGLAEGETVELGRIVFVEEPLRVNAVLVTLGEVVGLGRPLLDVSGIRQAVMLDLPVDDRDLAAVGDPVVVVLPGDVRTTGVITEISRVVKTVPDARDATQVVEVSIDLDDPGLAGELDRTPVEVELVSERAEDVLAVPVTALVALAEGGYAVQVVDGAERRLVPVEIGTFVDTLVEVTGPISEGDEVVVPR